MAKYRDPEWLEEKLEEETQAEIARECGVSQATIIRWRDKLGLGDWEPPIPRDELVRMHHDEKMTLTAIARRTESSYITVERSIYAHGIERRYYREGENNNGWKGGYDGDWRRTSAYQRLREKALEYAGHKCERCGSESGLHMHHSTPVRDGGEKFDESNVEILCEDCHEAVHGHAV